MNAIIPPVEKRAWYYKQEKVKSVRLTHLRNNAVRWSAIILTLLAIILFTADRLGRTDLFLIDEIEYHGVFTYVDQTAVDQATKNALSGNFFTVDLLGIQNALLAVSWIESADLGREWPNKIVININEYEPMMRWGNDGLVMKNGKLVRGTIESLPNADELKRLPILEGKPESLPEMMARYSAWKFELSALGMAIEKMVLSDSNAWTVSLRDVDQDTLELRLGSMEPNVRLERFMRLFSQGENYFKHLEYIDARYPNGVVVKRKLIEKIESELEKQTGETDA